jgi:hypothetical protein
VAALGGQGRSNFFLCGLFLRPLLGQFFSCDHNPLPARSTCLKHCFPAPVRSSNFQSGCYSKYTCSPVISNHFNIFGYVKNKQTGKGLSRLNQRGLYSLCSSRGTSPGMNYKAEFLLLLQCWDGTNLIRTAYFSKLAKLFSKPGSFCESFNKTLLFTENTRIGTNEPRYYEQGTFHSTQAPDCTTLTEATTNSCCYYNKEDSVSERDEVQQNMGLLMDT